MQPFYFLERFLIAVYIIDPLYRSLGMVQDVSSRKGGALVGNSNGETWLPNGEAKENTFLDRSSPMYRLHDCTGAGCRCLTTKQEQIA